MDNLPWIFWGLVVFSPILAPFILVARWRNGLRNRVRFFCLVSGFFLAIFLLSFLVIDRLLDAWIQSQYLRGLYCETSLDCRIQGFLQQGRGFVSLSVYVILSSIAVVLLARQRPQWIGFLMRNQEK